MAVQVIDVSGKPIASDFRTARLQLLDALRTFETIGLQLTSATDAAARTSLAGLSSGGDDLRDQLVGIGQLQDISDLSDAEIKTRAGYIATVIAEYR